MQSPSSSSPYVPGSSLDYSHHPSTSSMHPHQVFDHHHHLHYGLHHQIPPPPPPPPPPPSHHHSHHPGSHHHHQGNSHHPLQPPPPPPPSLGPSPLHHHHHHHSLNKRDHESMGGGSSDEDVGNDVKPPGFPESGGGGPGRGGRGSSLKGELSGGKKTKGRVKIKMEFIDNKLRRYTTFSKRKTGIMKKAYELSTLTGTQVMLLVASETGHVYTFATRKLQPMITSDAGKALIQTCLNSPDPSPHAGSSGGDQRMSATGYEETELTYNVAADEESQKISENYLKIIDEEEEEEEEDEDEEGGEYNEDDDLDEENDNGNPKQLEKQFCKTVHRLPVNKKGKTRKPATTKRKMKKEEEVEPKIHIKKRNEALSSSRLPLILPNHPLPLLPAHQNPPQSSSSKMPPDGREDSNDGPLNMMTSYLTSSHSLSRSSSGDEEEDRSKPGG